MSEQMSNVMTINDLETGMEVSGKVNNVDLGGAFVDVGIGTNAYLHISKLGQDEVRNVGDVLQQGQEITAYVLMADANMNRVALTMVKPPATPWETIGAGDNFKGEVVRIEDYGVFVDIGAERPGMVHVSELATGYVQSPNDVVKIGDEVEVRVLKVNRKKRQIDLSMKELEVEEIQEQMEDVTQQMTAMALAMQRAQDDGHGGNRRSKKQENRRRNGRRNSRDDIYRRTLDNHTN